MIEQKRSLPGKRIWYRNTAKNCSDPVCLHEVRISEVAVMVRLWLGKQYNGDNRKAVDDSCFEEMARRLREAGDLCASFGLPLPVVGIVELSGNDEELERKIERKAGNQDWHRGDFILLHMKSDEADREIERVLGGIDQLIEGLQIIKPMDVHELPGSIDRELRTRSELEAVQRSLVETIRDAIVNVGNIEQAVLNWTKGYLDIEGDDR